MRAEDKAVVSPLTHEGVLYCRWSIIRRKLSEGANDTISDELSTPFSVTTDIESQTVPLNSYALHLSDNQITAWTTRWEGLPSSIQTCLQERLPNHIEDALYHCEQVVLTDGASITWSKKSAFLTDLTIADTQTWSIKRPILPLLLAAVLGISAAAF